MTKLRKKTEEIRQFIIANVEKHSKDIASLTAKQFDITRQAVNKHIQTLVKEKALLVTGSTQSRHYSLQPLERWENAYPLDKSLEEHIVWQNDIAPRLGKFPENVMNIWLSPAQPTKLLSFQRSSVGMRLKTLQRLH